MKLAIFGATGDVDHTVVADLIELRPKPGQRLTLGW